MNVASEICAAARGAKAGRPTEWPHLLGLLVLVVALLVLQFFVERGTLGSWSPAIAAAAASAGLAGVGMWWGHPGDRVAARIGAVILIAGLFAPLPFVETAAWSQSLMPTTMISMGMLCVLITERSSRAEFIAASLLVAVAMAFATIA